MAHEEPYRVDRFLSQLRLAGKLEGLSGVVLGVFVECEPKDAKESLTLDVKNPRARTVLARLIERADVFLQNLAPGAADRLGLGAQTLRERKPALIWCGISGYGPSGPYAEKKAYDLLVQCEAGMLSVTGTPDAPSKAGIPVADIAAGMYAFSSILAALIRRQRTGEGATLDITMFEALGEWMGFPAYFSAYGGSAPPRSGAHHATIAPYGPFSTGDGARTTTSRSGCRTGAPSARSPGPTGRASASHLMSRCPLPAP